MNDVTAKTDNTSQIAQISTLVNNLNAKLRNFSVVDKQNEVVGKVKDVLLDSNRQISFIISESSHLAENRLFILRGQLVQKIDTTARNLILIVDKSQLDYLPEYIERETENNLSELPENLTVENSSQNSSTPYTPEANQANNFAVDSTTEEVREEDLILLLGEKIIVDRSKRKVGEVVVRKEIETRMVTIPVRHERLIVEQISPERKELANIYLGGEEITQVEPTLEQNPENVNNFNGSLTVSGEFSSAKIASLLLNAIALERNNGCKQVRVTITVEDEQHQQKYQEWFARTSIKKEGSGE